MAISYDQWHKKIEATLEWRNKYWNGTKAWLRFMALYRGDQWRNSKYHDFTLEPDSDKPRDKITVNVTGSSVLLAKSFLIKNRPKFIIKPKPVLNATEVMQAHIGAILQQETLNYEWGDKEAHFQNKEAILDALIIGHGITKDGFTVKANPAKNPKKDGEIDQREYIEDGTPFCERINPFRFIFDIESEYYRQLDSCRWVAEIFFAARSDVLANEHYAKKVLSKIKDNEYTPEYVEYKLSSSSDLKPEDTQRCCLYEVWDKQYRKRYVFIKGIEEPLEETEWPYDYLDGYPYTKVDFIPVPNEHYGIGIPMWIEDQQLELNRIRTQMYDHRRRYNRKYIIRGNIDASEEVKLISGDTGTLLHIPIGAAIEPLQELKVPSDAFAIEGTIKSDVQELTGLDQLARGGNLPSRTSAEEIRARQSYVNLKLDDRVEEVDAFILKNGRKMLQHIKANYEKERVVKISGQKGEFWVKFAPTDIKAEFDIDMETVSAPRIDETLDRQQRIQVLQLIMQNMQLLSQSGVTINFEELMKWVLESFNEKEISRFFPGISIIPSGQAGTVQPNTALNLPQLQNVNPQVQNPSQLINALQGNQSGGGPTGFIPGVQ